jgi:hypothetical protein
MINPGAVFRGGPLVSIGDWNKPAETAGHFRAMATGERRGLRIEATGYSGGFVAAASEGDKPRKQGAYM